LRIRKIRFESASNPLPFLRILRIRIESALNPLWIRFESASVSADSENPQNPLWIRFESASVSADSENPSKNGRILGGWIRKIRFESASGLARIRQVLRRILGGWIRKIRFESTSNPLPVLLESGIYVQCHVEACPFRDARLLFLDPWIPTKHQWIVSRKSFLGAYSFKFGNSSVAVARRGVAALWIAQHLIHGNHHRLQTLWIAQHLIHGNYNFFIYWCPSFFLVFLLSCLVCA
jgi:hypothetical protein